MKLIFFLLCSLQVFATTFQIQPVEKQLKDSDGVFIGHYLKKKYIELEDGKIATQMVFKMKKEIGLQSEFLGMGTYKVVRYGKDSMMVNTIFPHERTMGQIKLEEFEKKVREIKGGSLKVVSIQQYPIERDFETRRPASDSEGKNRTVAGGSEPEENKAAENGFHPMWLLAFLGFLGSCFRLARQRQ